MPATYDVGDSVLLTFTVKTLVGGVLTLTDATVALVVTKPDGSTVIPSPTHPSTGVYTAVVGPDLPGEWTYRWVATGTATTAEDGAFLVEPNAAATLYATVAELRASIGDDVRQAADAGLLEQALRSASRAVDDYCGRPGRKFWLDATVSARAFRPDDPWCAWVDDFGTATGLVVKTDTSGDGTWATTWQASDYQLEPLNAAAGGGAYAYNRIVAVGNQFFPQVYGRRPTLQVTARWGWSQVPDPVRTATTLLAARLFRRKDAVFGIDSGASFGDFGPIRITRSDADVMSLLAPYTLPVGVA